MATKKQSKAPVVFRIIDSYGDFDSWTEYPTEAAALKAVNDHVFNEYADSESISIVKEVKRGTIRANPTVDWE